MLQAVFAVNNDTLYFPLILLASILSSMQGFSNAAIYLRPRWIEFRKQRPTLTRLQVLQCALGFRDPQEGVTSSKFSGLGKRPYVSSVKNDDIVFDPTQQPSGQRVSAIIEPSSYGDLVDGEKSQQEQNPGDSTESSNENYDSEYMF